MADSIRKMRLTNVSTGKHYVLSEEEFEIAIDGEALVSVIAPGIGSREFLLNLEELESANRELGL